MLLPVVSTSCFVMPNNLRVDGCEHGMTLARLQLATVNRFSSISSFLHPSWSWNKSSDLTAPYETYSDFRTWPCRMRCTLISELGLVSKCNFLNFVVNTELCQIDFSLTFSLPHGWYLEDISKELLLAAEVVMHDLLLQDSRGSLVDSDPLLRKEKIPKYLRRKLRCKPHRLADGGLKRKWGWCIGTDVIAVAYLTLNL